MKLIIQIPCFNEADNLFVTINSIPRKYRGIDVVELLVIDDGSSDNTALVAARLGVEHVMRLKVNSGLAVAFSEGLKTSLRLGADIVVNTDGDNQYNAQDIQALIDPILDQRAEIVIGDRRVMQVDFFSPLKKHLQKIGSSFVSWMSGLDIPDVTSGFRAYSRKAIQNLEIFSEFTYTLETIYHAGKKKLAVTHVPVKTNKPLRKSRLFSSIGKYIYKSLKTLSGLKMLYFSGRSFALFGVLFLLTGMSLFLLVPGGNVKLYLLFLAFGMVGFNFILASIFINKIDANRKLTERSLLRIKEMENLLAHPSRTSAWTTFDREKELIKN